MFRLLPQIKNKKYKSILNLIYRNLNRNHFTFLKHTHLGQLLPQNSFDSTSIFLSDVYNSRLSMKYDDDVIANIDETPININIPPNYTITKKGKKNMIIRTQGQEKCRVSILWTILADGQKLSPIVIFKGKENSSKLNNELNENYNIKKKNFFAINSKAWCNNEIMGLWNKLIWRKYLDSLGDTVPSLLIMDKASMYKMPSVIKNIEQYDTEVKFIPSGMTRILQPLDMVINKPFRDLIRKKYVEYSKSINRDNAKVSYKKY